jgi:hypothetical protein
MVAGAIVLLLLGYVFGYGLGWTFGRQSIREIQKQSSAQEEEITKLTLETTDQAAANQNLTDELKKAQGSLNEVFFPTRQVKLTANHSERVSVGAFTVGLASALGSTTVTVNLNGTQKSMAPGDSQSFTFNCRIELGSFDVLNSSAVVNTSCSPVNSTSAMPN